MMATGVNEGTGTPPRPAAAAAPPVESLRSGQQAARSSPGQSPFPGPPSPQTQETGVPRSLPMAPDTGRVVQSDLAHALQQAECSFSVWQLQVRHLEPLARYGLDLAILDSES